jgi:di/tricarboxylate transporter
MLLFGCFWVAVPFTTWLAIMDWGVQDSPPESGGTEPPTAWPYIWLLGALISLATALVLRRKLRDGRLPN